MPAQALVYGRAWCRVHEHAHVREGRKKGRGHLGSKVLFAIPPSLQRGYDVCVAKWRADPVESRLNVAAIRLHGHSGRRAQGAAGRKPGRDQGVRRGADPWLAAFGRNLGQWAKRSTPFAFVRT